MRGYFSHESTVPASAPARDLTGQPPIPLEAVIDLAGSLITFYLGLLAERDARIADLEWRLSLDLVSWKPDEGALL